MTPAACSTGLLGILVSFVCPVSKETRGSQAPLHASSHWKKVRENVTCDKQTDGQTDRRIRWRGGTKMVAGIDMSFVVCVWLD